jgi:8-oxo-dGTP pyrophosphatase MutT (NUDIX family)
MSRKSIPSGFFVFVIVEHEGHVLLIRERKHGQLWYAPAGGLEPGESIWQAAIRETMEEAGVAIQPLSLLKIEQEWHPEPHSEHGLRSWWRFVIRARPLHTTREGLAPKSTPDEHSLEARWVLPHHIHTFDLRHPEVIDLVTMAVALDRQQHQDQLPRAS